MVIVIATIEVAEGRREEFLAEFRKIVPAVQAEQGCIEYGPTVDAATNIAAQGPVGENVAVIVEKWESVPALEAHLKAPHMAEYRERVKDLVKSVGLEILAPV
ncbi:MAG: antibiotic biosynthesis monooxygenase [Planctomycetes bacterium]|nr:antibiotic biosynthesis monooxygenase [Planctomycetota bacterium]